MPTTTTYTASGLTCEHCVNAVTSELAALDGVQRVTVDLVAGGESQVTVTSDRELPVDAVAGALDAAGDYVLQG